MGLNDTPSGERVHIGFFGLRNAGKSSLLNAIAGQNLAVVSDVPGTTTDTVRKAMELLPAGPVELIDTPGIDDEGTLGQLRVEKAREALRRCHVAVLAAPATRALAPAEHALMQLFEQRKLPYLVVRTKADLLTQAEDVPAPANLPNASPTAPAEPAALQAEDMPAATPTASPTAPAELFVSGLTGAGIFELKKALAALAAEARPHRRAVADLLSPGSTVVLVIPLDESAPAGRIILPQQLVLRDILDAHCTAVCCQPEELTATLANLALPPALVITDSQAFAQVAPQVPQDLALTSFSIIMARYKGELATFRAGAAALDALTNESRVLIAEGCTHHRQCNDIGTVQLPGLIRAHTHADPVFEFTSGGCFPCDVSAYSLVIHCGACMLNEKEMQHRAALCAQSATPLLNYGMAFAHLNGILARALQPFA